jgi:uncharacterized membrane protein
MNKDRKILVVFALGLVAVICICMIVAAVIASGDHPRRAFPWLIGVLVALWLGSAVASVLKDNPEE